MNTLTMLLIGVFIVPIMIGWVAILVVPFLLITFTAVIAPFASSQYAKAKRRYFEVFDFLTTKMPSLLKKNKNIECGCAYFKQDGTTHIAFYEHNYGETWTHGAHLMGNSSLPTDPANFVASSFSNEKCVGKEGCANAAYCPGLVTLGPKAEKFYEAEKMRAGFRSIKNAKAISI